MKKPTDLALAKHCKEYALDKKATEPVILDLRKLSGPADFFVIVSAESEPQLKAIASYVEKMLHQKEELRSLGTHGTASSGWMIIDYGTILVHVMHPSKRSFYDLQNLWRDAKLVD